MKRNLRMPWRALFAAVASTAAALTQAQSPATAYVDGIAAVVNQQVITVTQLDDEIRLVQAELAARAQANLPVPDQDTLRKQILQRLIITTLEKQEADRLGVRVSEAQVQQALARIAERNRISVEQLRAQVAQDGTPWENYLRDLYQEVRLNQLRQQAVDNLIHITEADVDAYLRSAGSREPSLQDTTTTQNSSALGLAQILVTVPQEAPASQTATLREQAQHALARLHAGEDFNIVAAAFSAPSEIDLGVRAEDEWPDLFQQAAQGLQVGQVSDIVQSPVGFHILRVTQRGAPNQASASNAAAPQDQEMLVTQTHARHILIKTNTVVSDAQAQTRLQQLAQRLEYGSETFEDLARRYSQDATAPQGGDLGWLSPGATVPAFEQAMNSLSPGDISPPIQSPFGWHLIQVLERRTHNMEDEYRRMQARQVLFERRADPAYEDWIGRLRAQAFIDNRLDPRPTLQRR